MRMEEERLLPLQGGNNFRDLGGYGTADGRVVRRGQVFRSGLMTGLTVDDQALLDRLGITTVVDLRSREELEIFPNHWAKNSGLNLIFHEYSIMDLAEETRDELGERVPVHMLYRIFPKLLKPQLQLLFAQLVAGNTPLVFNCAAGQDRTGLASALLLRVLDVPWATILEDYHLSTRFRRMELELADVDFQQAAETNAFARMMLRHKKGEARPEPLMTEDEVPYLHFAFDSMEAEYGSVHGYLQSELGINKSGVARLRDLYLE